MARGARRHKAIGFYDEVIRKRHLEGLTTSLIAQRLGTTRQFVHEAMKRMREEGTMPAHKE